MRLSLVLTLSIAACSPKVVTEHETLTMRVSDADDCRPGTDVSTLRLEALGDFPARDALFADLRRGEEWDPITRFPPETQLLTARGLAPSGSWGAGSTALDGGDAEILLLPFGRSCPVADPAVAWPPSSQAAALEDGTVILVGGRGIEGALGVGLRRLLRIGPGAQRAERIPDEMAEPRQGMSATAVGPRVLIAGGALGDRSVAYDTFEVYDDGARALTRRGSMLQRRHAHGAVALDDRQVLLLGGEVEAGDSGGTLASAEIVDAVSGTTRSVGEMPTPRVAPLVAALDDGTVLVAGGSGDTRVLGFDRDTETFVVAQNPDGTDASLLPCHEHLIALPGGRALAFGSCASFVLLRRLPPYIPGGLVVETASVLDRTALPTLSNKRAVPLPDGRVLLEGEDLVDGTARAFLLDLSLETASEVEASRRPEQLIALGDGAVLELGESGSSIRRELLRTPLDNPPATLLGGLMDGVVFDRVGSFVADGGSFRAERDDARIDLPSLTFADVSVRVEAPEGGVDLLLLGAGRAPVRLSIRADTFGPPLCEVRRTAGAPVELTRRADGVEIFAGEDVKLCRLPGLSERVGLALVATRGVHIGALRVTRLTR